MVPKPVLIYHANCNDGIAAAYAFYHRFGDALEYFAGSYGKPLPPVAGRHVIFADFSAKPDVMRKICKEAVRVVVVDHHARALEELKPLLQEFDNLDLANSATDKSGAVLAWEFANIGEKLPVLFEYVQDRDLWKWVLPYSRTLSRYINLKMNSISDVGNLVEVFEDISNPEFEKILEISRALEEQHEDYLKSVLKGSIRLVDYDGLKIYTVNANGMFASDAGNYIAQTHKVGAVYADLDDCRVFSLRSDGSVDVSAIAAKFGGGGHPAASGFKVDRDHYLAKV